MESKKIHSLDDLVSDRYFVFSVDGGPFISKKTNPSDGRYLVVAVEEPQAKQVCEKLKEKYGTLEELKISVDFLLKALSKLDLAGCCVFWNAEHISWIEKDVFLGENFKNCLDYKERGKKKD